MDVILSKTSPGVPLLVVLVTSQSPYWLLRTPVFQACVVPHISQFSVSPTSNWLKSESQPFLPEMC